MFAPSKIKVGARAVALALALATTSFSAHAVLQRTGPVSVDPSVGGFPAWYQDTTGLALEFCAPTNASEVNGGWCLLLPPVTAPETFPSNFFIEHFYFDAVGQVAPRTGGRATMVMAQEASFANGFNVVPGDQIVFARIRVFFTAIPVTGTYRIIHPYGEEVLQGVAGDRIFFTEDVGLGCGQDFTCAMNGRLGPYLLPSATPGGAEMPPLTATNPTPDTDPAHFNGAFAPTPYPGNGKTYIADPARIGPVTGSPLPNFIDSTGASRNHNVFRIEGPVGSGLGIDPVTGAVVDYIETSNFQLAGRVYTGTMPAQAKVDRASYTRNATGIKVDVLATGQPSTSARIPGAVAAPAVAPTLSFFDAACAGTLDPVTGAILPPYSAPVAAVQTQMLATGAEYWGQVRETVLPTTICMENSNARDALGNLVPTFEPHVVTDEVTITQAAYDQGLGTLTVAATSSDTLVPPALNLAYDGISAPLVAGQVVVPNVAVPPARITVTSSALGSNDLLVSTSFPAPPPPAAPQGTADSYTFAEDSGPQILNILANDLNVAGGTVTITSRPTLGSLVVNANGTVTYTSNLNANGVDSFTYTVTVGTQVTSPTSVSLNITPVNDPPVAVNDTATTPINTSLAINLLANDTDPDGVADLANASIVTPPGGGASITAPVGGVVNFSAATAGTYSFTYKAVDKAGALSANTATVTVTVVAPFTVTINKNQYTTSQRQLLVEGVTTDPGSPTVTIQFLNSAGTVLSTAGTAIATAGKFKFGGVVPLPAGATTLKASEPNGVAGFQAIIFK